MASRPHWWGKRLAMSAAALTAATLVSCTSEGPGEAIVLRAALLVDLDGFEATSPAEPPTELCSPGDGNPGGIDPPELAVQPGVPSAVGYRSEQADLNAYAWAASDAATAQAFVEGLAAVSSDCDFEYFYDADTDGDGELDPGGQEVQAAGPWTGSGWTGISIAGGSSGATSQVRETRLVWQAEVALLVVVTSEDGSDREAVAAILDSFLATVDQRLD